MTNIEEIGVYRGSLDPPHFGHEEVVAYCFEKLKVSKLYIFYKDFNLNKPFRSSDKIRREMLETVFKIYGERVVISENSYLQSKNNFAADPSIGKIWEIVGSDIFHENPAFISKLPSQSKVELLVIPRKDWPIPENIQLLAGHRFSIAEPTFFKHQIHSSTEIKQKFFFTQNHDIAFDEIPLSGDLIKFILDRKIYAQSPEEREFRPLLEQVKKSVAQNIGPFIHSYPLSITLEKESGKSPDLVAYIIGDNQDIQVVLKIFQGCDRQIRYDSERTGFAMIQGMRLKTAIVPEELFTDTTSNFQLIGMTYAKGERLDTLLDQQSETVHLFAEALAEMHFSKTLPSWSILPEERLRPFDCVVSNILNESLPFYGFCDDILEPIKNLWGKARSSFKNSPGAYSYTHGDPHPGNCLVDLENQKVSFIDFSAFHLSQDSLGAPFGFALQELYQAHLELGLAGEKMNLKPEQIDAIQSTFVKTYLKFAPRNIEKTPAAHFFQFYWHLCKIKTRLVRLETVNSDTQEQQSLRSTIIFELDQISKKYAFCNIL